MRITKLIAAATTALALVAAPATHAAEQGNVVTFGDSYVANPRINGDTSGNQWTHGCMQASDNWPRLLAQQTGIPVNDYSCNGRTSRDTLERIDQAIAAGDLHRGTRAVAISVGANNYWGPGLANGVNVFNYNDVERNYVSDLRAAARKIRSVAPQAKIIMPGMLSVTEPTGLNGLCWVNLRNPLKDLTTLPMRDMQLGTPLPFVQNVENNLRWVQAQAARAIGAEFIDIKEMTKGNNTCAPADVRYVSGYFDNTTRDYNMVYHPSREGSRFVAGQVAARL